MQVACATDVGSTLPERTKGKKNYQNQREESRGEGHLAGGMVSNGWTPLPSHTDLVRADDHLLVPLLANPTRGQGSFGYAPC
jgi:hypothetical protein